jgi:uncharacterized protein DUF4136
MKSNMFRIALIGAAIITFVSCQKDPLKNLSPAEARIYITNHDSTVNFPEFKTFSIADSVGVIEDNQVLGKSLAEFDANAIAAFAATMQSRGFQQVNRSESPDLGITITRIYSNHTGIMSYPGYWDSYGGYYDPYYWGYGGFDYYDPTYYGPNYYTTYQVTQGALSIDMLNLKDAETDNVIRPVWSGLSRGSGVFGVSGISGQISAFFDQSPYLTTNQ